MRQVNASSSIFAVNVESSTPMARLALQMSGLCLFVSFPDDSIQHSSIKVYLSAVRTLHIEQGFPDPLLNCLRLQRVLRGVKRSQGSPAARRLPITDSLLLVIHRALDLTNFDHCAFWAACMLGILVFSVLQNLLSPILLASRQLLIFQWQTSQWIRSSRQPVSVFG